MFVRRWWQPLAALGRATLDVVVAEIEVLRNELRGGARQLGIALLGVLVAVHVASLGLGFTVLALTRFLSQSIPDWLAALIPGLALILAGVLLALWAKKKVSGLEGPAEMVIRRWREQDDWWRRNILQDPDERRAGNDGD